MKAVFKNARLTSLLIFFTIVYCLIVGRLFYWQVVRGDKARQLAWGQYRSLANIPAVRGEILASDNFPLVSNRPAYLLYVSLANLTESIEKITDQIAPLLLTSVKAEKLVATESSYLKDEEIIKDIKKELSEKLQNTDIDRIVLRRRLTSEDKKGIENLKIEGLGFEEEESRFYPEASMSAQLLGFVGKDDKGQDKGYFGLEGYYDLELKGRPGLLAQEKYAGNKPILIGSFIDQEKRDGKTLILHLDRVVQYLVEQKLKNALKKYGAKSGYVVIMDPYTGGIISMASFPDYHPDFYFKSNELLFKNPVVAETYEPGSTFKIFIMAAALNEDTVKPDSQCDICDGPYKIDKYTIKTWNDKYYPKTTMTEVIEHSDNIGMVYVSKKLTLEKLWLYLQKFGFDEKTDIDLQEEAEINLKPKDKWTEIDTATVSFGQGIAVNGMQIIRATAAIANGGDLLEPHVVKQIISGKKIVDIKPKVLRRVIKGQTAKILTNMMTNAVDNGETKFTKKTNYKIAGKTGTAQIPIAGHYDRDKTIASFVGFAPADKPKFVMLVTLREPTTSPWASETAAPLFFNITGDLMNYYGIQPE